MTWLGVIVGAVLLATMLILGLLGALASRTHDYDPLLAGAEGVTNLDVSVGHGDLSIICGSSKTFVLTQENVTNRWHMEAEGSTIRIWQDLGSWFRSGAFEEIRENVVLRVPQSLCEQNLTAHLTVDSGRLDVTTDLDSATIDVMSGDLSLSGAANAVRASVEEGSAQLSVYGAETVDLDVSTGTITGSLAQVPQTLAVDVAEGNASLALPAGNYAVSTDARSGSINNNLAIDADGPAGTVDVKVEAGTADLRKRS